MRKLLLALLLSVSLAASSFVAFAAEVAPVAAVDGKVTISVPLSDVAEDTPVLIFILPAIMNNGEDVTAARVQDIETISELNALNVDHIAIDYVNDGKIEHECMMSASLPTGVCHVVFNYIGAEEGCFSVGTFEHVGGADKAALLEALNGADKDTCAPIIYDDINGELDDDGETRLTPKEILRKSSADVVYYNSLSEEAEPDTQSEKDRFHELLYQLKGNEDFTLTSLIDNFNKAGIWMRLALEEDTLNVLTTYNGDGIGKYWNIAIGSVSDFSVISETERTALLTKIKAAGYSDKETLQADFHEGVLLAMFRAATTREELQAVISADGTYGEDFAAIREIIDGVVFSDEFEEASYYNAVLDKNARCETMEDITVLFRDSVPDGGEEEEETVIRPVKPNKGTSSITVADPIVKEEETPVPDEKEIPFKDVADSHWAHTYIKQLYGKGAINGVSEDAFMPEGSIQRQDFVKILIGAMGIETSKGSSSFSDVPAAAYYAEFIMTAYENNLISGIGDGVFGVGNNISRQDAAVIMDRVLKMRGISISGNKDAFADDPSIAEYAKDAVANVASAGIFGGDDKGNFNPKNNLSRAEACAILCRLAQKLGEV